MSSRSLHSFRVAIRFDYDADLHRPLEPHRTGQLGISRHHLRQDGARDFALLCERGRTVQHAHHTATRKRDSGQTTHGLLYWSALPKLENTLLAFEPIS